MEARSSGFGDGEAYNEVPSTQNNIEDMTNGGEAISECPASGGSDEESAEESLEEQVPQAGGQKGKRQAYNKGKFLKEKNNSSNASVDGQGINKSFKVFII